MLKLGGYLQSCVEDMYDTNSIRFTILFIFSAVDFALFPKELLGLLALQLQSHSSGEDFFLMHALNLLYNCVLWSVTYIYYLNETVN